MFFCTVNTWVNFMKSKREISLVKLRVIQHFAKQRKEARYKRVVTVYEKSVLPQTPEAICIVVNGKIINPEKVIKSLERDGYINPGKNDRIEVEPIKIIKNIGKTIYEIWTHQEKRAW